MATRYDPFGEMDRLFNNVMRSVPGTPGMPMDLYRQGNTYVAKFDLPGVEASSIDIDIDEGRLTVRAERKALKDENIQWQTHERPAGTSARQLTLGNGIDSDNISADYSDGVLTLTIPVAEAAQPRKITVQTSGTHSQIEA